mmetsp:Transcript_20684/g.66921  ORF Transcript_20684/g.66921 Transcript_20684/m.66921 type:complete len:299 (-) Transcript_20684:503-1399(-)
MVLQQLRRQRAGYGGIVGWQPLGAADVGHHFIRLEVPHAERLHQHHFGARDIAPHKVGEDGLLRAEPRARPACDLAHAGAMPRGEHVAGHGGHRLRRRLRRAERRTMKPERRIVGGTVAIRVGGQAIAPIRGEEGLCEGRGVSQPVAEWDPPPEDGASAARRGEDVGHDLLVLRRCPTLGQVRRRRGSQPVRLPEEGACVAVRGGRVRRAEALLAPHRLSHDPLRPASVGAVVAVHEANVDFVAHVAVVEREQQRVPGERERLEHSVRVGLHGDVAVEGQRVDAESDEADHVVMPEVP